MQVSITNQQVKFGQAASQALVTEVNLSLGEVFTLTGDQRGVRLESVRGLVWVTQPGDPQDYWLRPGQTVMISRKGKVVVTGGLPGGTACVACWSSPSRETLR